MRGWARYITRFDISHPPSNLQIVVPEAGLDGPTPRPARAVGALIKLADSGTGGRTRTGTLLRAGDFESPVSTNFTTPA